jgi:hypothetical protein
MADNLNTSANFRSIAASYHRKVDSSAKDELNVQLSSTNIIQKDKWSMVLLLKVKQLYSIISIII